MRKKDGEYSIVYEYSVVSFGVVEAGAASPMAGHTFCEVPIYKDVNDV